MLQKLREKTSGWIAIVVVGILIIPFAFFGVTDYFSASADTWVARVGDSEISQQTYQQRFEEYRSQMRQMMGDRYDSRQIESPETRQALLDRLVDEEVLRQAAAKQGVMIPPSVLQRQIADIPAFQVDGRFNVDQYRLLLAGQNMTPREFEQRIFRDLEVREIPQQIESSAFATGFDVDRYLALRDQKRDLRFLMIDPPPLGEGDVADEALQAFYEANSARYLSDETATIEYIELDGSTLEVPTVADEQTLQQRYEDGKNRFVEPEQRLTSHILIKTAADADADAQRAAQVVAQTIADEARAEGADFAAIAKERSEDPGSRLTGGDLGWLERGFTDEAFESALFDLESGEISDPVKSAEGWHVIQLRDVKAEKRKEFADVRAELEKEFLESERERRYSGMAGQMVDALYRDPTTLATAAKELDLEIKTVGPFGRVGGADPVSANPQVLEAAFSRAVLTEGNVSDAIDMGQNRLLALRVVEHSPAAPIPLADIRDAVVRDYHLDEQRQASISRAESLFERWQAGASLEELAEEVGGEIKTEAGVGRSGVTVDPQIASAAFELPHPKDGSTSKTRVALNGDRHSLVEVTAVVTAEQDAVDAASRQALQSQLAQSIASSETQAYLKALRAQFEVRLAPERM